MCQAHLIKRLDSNITNADIGEMERLMCFGSLSNHDGWGLFNGNRIVKNNGKFNSAKYNPGDFLNDDFIVGHNRLSTSFNLLPKFARNDRNEIRQHHPFTIGQLALVHNGVISNNLLLRGRYNIDSSINTDSFVILWLINHYLVDSKDPIRRRRNLAIAIKKAATELEGTFSVIVYDNKSDSLFYFKEDCTDFQFIVIDDKIICGSTKWQNLDYIYFDAKKCREHPISSNKIYLIGEKGEKPIQEVGSFEPKIKKSFWGDEVEEFHKEKVKEEKKKKPQDEKGLVKKPSIKFSFPFNMFIWSFCILGNIWQELITSNKDFFISKPEKVNNYNVEGGEK